MSESRGEIPKKIDRYEIIEAVGYGAMGAVYKAFDPLIKRPVAVKTLRLDVPPDSPDYKAFLARFATEARTAGRLSHPNIVTLYDVAPADVQVPWLAMEFVEGQTVAELLEGERLRAEVVVGLVSQIASAIDYAHSEGVIHRDIKPSNVIVYGGEKVKVTDFGIAKLMDAEVTHSGLMMGTPSYMSPEQAMGEDLDGRTDIFSLGVVAFEMLSGQQPFPGNNVTSILYKLVHSDPVHPDDLEVLGLLPDKWHEVFSRVLAKDPAERFPTAADFVKQLEHCLGSWFGALEGETVIMKDGTAWSGDETVTSAPTLVPPAPEPPPKPVPEPEPVSDESDETVSVPPPSPLPEMPEVTRPLDDSTATLDGSVTLAGAVTNVPAKAPGSVDATVYVPPPESTAEETLYAGGADRTLTSAELVDETLLDAKTASPAVATVRRPKADHKRRLVLGGGVLALFWVVFLMAWLMGRGEPPPPVEVAIPPPPPVVVESGRLRITSNPEGAVVMVNGEQRGETPLDLDELPLAVYELNVSRDGFIAEEVTAELTAGNPDATIDLELRPSAPAPPPPAYVRIRSTPSDADVQIDGKAVGATPLDRIRVGAGTRTVRILQDGYLPWEDTVRARSGQTVTVDAVLTERPRTEPAVTDVEPEVSTPRVERGALVERGEPGVENPECIECPAVGYPEAARRNRLQGVVLLSFIINENGTVENIEVLESAGEVFDSAVTETVRGWRYEPATKYDVPVKIQWVQRFRFRQGR